MHTTDLHATLLALMGLDHEQLTYRYAGRDFRLTDVAGNVVSGDLWVADLVRPRCSAVDEPAIWPQHSNCDKAGLSSTVLIPSSRPAGSQGLWRPRLRAA